MKETYRIEAEKAGLSWHGRRYDRQNPNAADLPNQALNHAASAVEAAAAIAVAATATIPQLGFIHEESGQSFVLDIADLMRDTVTIPVAFKAAGLAKKRPQDGIERIARRMAGERLTRDDVIATLIRRIKTILAEPAEGEDDRPLRKRMASGAVRGTKTEGEGADGDDGDRDA